MILIPGCSGTPADVASSNVLLHSGQCPSSRARGKIAVVAPRCGVHLGGQSLANRRPLERSPAFFLRVRIAYEYQLVVGVGVDFQEV